MAGNIDDPTAAPIGPSPADTEAPAEPSAKVQGGPAEHRDMDLGVPPVTPPTDPRILAMTLRDVGLDGMSRLLRAALGMSPGQTGLGEWAAGYRRFLPRAVPDVDVDGWIAWTLAGLPLFKAGLPTLRRARDTASSIVMVVTLAREGGNLSSAGRTLDTSRKVLRDNLRRLGLYPWPSKRTAKGRA